MMRTLAHTLGRLNPQLGRQVRASLAMDSEDLTFDSSATHARFPEGHVPPSGVAGRV